MLDQINAALDDYEQKWQKFIGVRKDKKFFNELRPTAVGWKVTDRAEYDAACQELHDKADQIIETWMNGRWVAKFHLKEVQLANGAEIVKIMERRPGSIDAVGLDHVDFYSTEVAHAESHLQTETDVKWTVESNDIIEGYDWISVWFDGTEAKLKSDTVLDIIQAELKELNEKIIHG